MYCYNCGQDCKDARFCSNCGVKLGNGAQVQAEEVFPEPGTAAFEAKRAELVRRRIPHCPECLSTYVQALIVIGFGETSYPYNTRHVCMWCGAEWKLRTKKEFKEYTHGR